MFCGKKVSAIVPAAGLGTRMGGKESKTWLKLAGQTMIEQTLLALCEGNHIDEVVIVGKASDQHRFEAVIESVKGRFTKKEMLPKFLFATGGQERLDSVYNGLKSADALAQLILVHDGARPLVTEQVIVNALNAAVKHGAAVACVASKDTVKIGLKGFVKETPERSTVYNVQTPQCFRRDIIFEAYHRAALEDVKATDDAGLVERLGYPVAISEGSYDNIKVTTPEDVIVAEAILNNRRRLL